MFKNFAAKMAAMMLLFVMAVCAFAQSAPVMGVNPRSSVRSLPQLREVNFGGLQPLPQGLQLRSKDPMDFGAIDAAGNPIRDVSFEFRKTNYRNPAVIPTGTPETDPGGFRTREVISTGPNNGTVEFAPDYDDYWAYYRLVSVGGQSVSAPVMWVYYNNRSWTGGLPPTTGTPGGTPGAGGPTFTISNPNFIVVGGTVNFNVNLGNNSGQIVLCWGTFPNCGVSQVLQPGQTAVQVPALNVGALDVWIEVRNGSSVVRSGSVRCLVVPSLLLMGPAEFQVGAPLLVNLVAPGVPNGTTATIRFEELRIGGGQTFEFPARVGETFVIPQSLPAGRYRVSFVMTIGGVMITSPAIEITIFGTNVTPANCRFTARLTGQGVNAELGRSGEVPTVPSAMMFEPSFFDLTGARVPNGVMKTVYLDPDDDSPSTGYLPQQIPSGLGLVAAFAEVSGCGEVGQGFVVRGTPASNFSNPPTGLAPFRVRPLTSGEVRPGDMVRVGLFIGDQRVTGVASAFVYTMGARNVSYLRREGDDFLLPATPGLHYIFAWELGGRWSRAFLVEVRQ